MVLGYFLTKDPEIYDTLMDMIDEYRAVVAGYNKQLALKDIAARLVRPDDQIIGKTTEVYAAQYTTGEDEYLLLMTAPLRVPLGQGVLHLGWMAYADLGADGILQVDLEGIKRQEIMARWAYLSDFHIYIEPQQIVFARSNDKIAWIIRNASGVDLTCVVYPLAFLIGPRKQLLV